MYEHRGIAEGIAAMGRGGDSTLMHVHPAEVEALNAMSPGSITINPDTGLPEAFFWILPALMLKGLGAAAGGLGTALGGSGLGGMLSGALGGGALGSTAAAPLTALSSAASTVGSSLGGLAGAMGAPMAAAPATGAANVAIPGVAGTTGLAPGAGVLAPAYGGGTMAGSLAPGAGVLAPQTALSAGAGGGLTAGSVTPAQLAAGVSGTQAAAPAVGGLSQAVGGGIEGLASKAGSLAAGQVMGPADTLAGGLNAVTQGAKSIGGGLKSAVGGLRGSTDAITQPLKSQVAQQVAPQRAGIGQVLAPQRAAMQQVTGQLPGVDTGALGQISGQVPQATNLPGQVASLGQGGTMTPAEFQALQAQRAAGGTVDLTSEIARPGLFGSDPLMGDIPGSARSLTERVGRAGRDLAGRAGRSLGKQAKEFIVGKPGELAPRMIEVDGKMVEAPHGITQGLGTFFKNPPGGGNILERTLGVGTGGGASFAKNPMLGLGGAYMIDKWSRDPAEVPEWAKGRGRGDGVNPPGMSVFDPNYQMTVLNDPVWGNEIYQDPYGPADPFANMGGFHDPYEWYGPGWQRPPGAP